ncbi:MAG: NAD(P)H-hydrate dehydratase [Oscillospiraceae bacterium]|nr:NAD(P)H-hydrate dehydratase [Oscillospiraceae bacterium]
MKFAGSKAMKGMDEYTIHTLGVPSDILMLRAAFGLFQAADSLLKSRERGAAVIFCGSGNNGGDGIAAAKYLLEAGYPVKCFMAGSREKMTSDSRKMEALLTEAGGVLLDYSEAAGAQAVEECTLVIDALFGTGLSRDIGGSYAELIDAINNSGRTVLSCDIPSGISADTGAVLGCAVKADVTVTFNLPKTGQLLPPGTEYTGRLIVHDIGIPREARDQAEFDGEYVTEEMVRAWLPGQRLESHKGDYGKLLLLCGSTGFTGAAALAAKAALRTGAGLVYLGVPDAVYPILAGKLDEPVVFPLPGNGNGRFGRYAVAEIEDRLRDKSACLVGPGIGRGYDIEAVVDAVLEKAECPVVLDADGINVLAGHIDRLDRANVPLVLTPHEGEFLRLGGDLSRGRIAGAKAMAERTGAVIVLKGYRTITASPDGQVYVNSTGNPGMATGGSGDVLAGILTCLLGQGMEPVKAAASAVWIHGAAGDLSRDRLGVRSMLPTDMIDALSSIFK